MNRPQSSSPPLPPREWFITLDALLDAANQIIDQHRFESVLERSDRSEARYLHVRRGHTWYGLRIASHFPAYPCSRDYWQIITSPTPTPTERSYYCVHIREKVRSGGNVVADPKQLQNEFARQHQPHYNLDAHAKAALRHRANLMAKWSHQQCTASL
ncbi:MAG: hypothetical protein ACE361_03105 [Aureliella sp.]